ncbi:MAG: hypothetical protein WBD31_17575 [Rubripirellula sp.]
MLNHCLRHLTFLIGFVVASAGFSDAIGQDLITLLTNSRSAKLLIQMPTGDDVVTSVDLRQHRYKFNRRTLVDAYQEVGARNEKWDDAAVDFLDDMAKYFSRTGGNLCSAKLASKGENVMELGCEDPLVRYCRAVMMSEGDASDSDRGKAMQMIEESYPLIVVRRYPAIRCFAAADRLRKFYEAKDGESKKAKK